MRRFVVALSIVAFAAGLSVTVADAAKEPAKTKMGCIVGKEKWDATAGKCAPAAKAAVKKAAPAKK